MSASSKIDALVVTLLERVEGEGSRVDQVLDELCRAHPEEAPDLRLSVRMLGEAGLLPLDQVDSGALPKQLGPYRILARLGSGGMGVVYCAQPEQGAQPLALKVLRPEQLLFDGARARFRREVEAVGRLEHPGIARLAVVGEQDGLPYCGFELVRGASLDRVLASVRGREPASLRGEDLRLAVQAGAQAIDPDLATDPLDPAWEGGWVEAMLRLGRDLAQALAHAHSRGVLHRDVKPSNVVLGVGGQAKLVDFGLASLAGARRVTRTGAQLGSLPYMAPEQVRGEAQGLGPHTDVYGLGVTLYELLTLELPFGAEPAPARERILAGQARPLGQLNPQVAPEVARVVHKAMAPEPEARYASAAELAADLGNLLALRPVHARGPSTGLRLRRWFRRRPAQATASVLGLAFVAVGPLGWALHLKWTNLRIERAYGAEQQARGVAERHRDAVLAALGDVISLRTALENTPRLQAERLERIDRGLEVYSALEADNPEDPLVLVHGARLYRVRGDARLEQDQLEPALADFRAGVACAERAAQLDPTLRMARDQRGALRHEVGRALQSVRRHREALPWFERALADLRWLAETGPPMARRDLAVGLGNTSQALRNLGRVDEAQDAIDEGLGLINTLVQEEPDQAAFHLARGILLENAVKLLPKAEQGDLLEASVQAYERALELVPGSREYSGALSSGLLSLGRWQRSRGLLGPATTSLERAKELLADLIQGYPAILDYAEKMDDCRQQLAVLGAELGGVEEALQSLLTQAQEAAGRARSKPVRTDLAMKAGITWANLCAATAHNRGSLELGLGAHGEAARWFAKARELGVETPPQGQVEWFLAYSRGLLLVRSVEAARAWPEVQAFEEREERSDALRWVYAADLWFEQALACRGRQEGEPEGRALERGFELLGRALEGGYVDLHHLDTNAVFGPYRADARFVDLRARMAAAEGSSESR